MIGHTVSYSRSSVYIGNRATPAQFEHFCLHQRHHVYVPRWFNGHSFMQSEYDSVAILLDPSPPRGPGPHRDPGYVRAWWSEQNLARTAAELEALLELPHERL